MATLPLPSPGLERGWKCYVTPAFSGIPNAKRGEQNQRWSHTEEGQSELATAPLPFGGPTSVRNCYVTPAYILGGPRKGGQTRPIRRARVSLLTANRILRNSQASLFYFFVPAAVSECVFLSFFRHCGNSELSLPFFSHTFSDADSPRHSLAC